MRSVEYGSVVYAPNLMQIHVFAYFSKVWTKHDSGKYPFYTKPVFEEMFESYLVEELFRYSSMDVFDGRLKLFHTLTSRFHHSNTLTLLPYKLLYYSYTL